MRIFLSCLQSKQKHLIPAYQFWETYFKNGIEEAQHEWIEEVNVDWAEGLVYRDKNEQSEWRNRTWNIVIDSIKKQHHSKPIDFFLSYFYPSQIDPSAIREIQSLGIPCVNFFCDNIRQFAKIPKEFSCFDLHWVPEFKALAMYQKAGLKYIYAPMPVWIPPNRRTYEHPELYGVSFIGSRDIQREYLLAKALESNVIIDIRGAGWYSNIYPSDVSAKSIYSWQTIINQIDFIQSQGILAWLRKIQRQPITNIPHDIFDKFVKEQPDANEYSAIIQNSRITLGVNRYPSYRYSFYKPDTYSRMRDIEAPMMGACYLTEWTEGIEELYELGTEIETYKTSDEMVEKIIKLEADFQKRRKMRYLGQKRALSKHTVSSSLIKISSSLGISQ